MSDNILQTRPWDAAEYLQSEEDMIAYLDAALEDEDVGLIAAVLGDIARAKEMTQPDQANLLLAEGGRVYNQL